MESVHVHSRREVPDAARGSFVQAGRGLDFGDGRGLDAFAREEAAGDERLGLGGRHAKVAREPFDGDGDLLLEGLLMLCLGSRDGSFAAYSFTRDRPGTSKEFSS